MKKETFEKYISENLSVREIAKLENVSRSTIRYWLEKYNLRTSYDNKNVKGSLKKEDFIRIYLIEKSVDYRKNQQIKSLLFKFDLKTNKCEKCGLKDKWQGQKINLQLDHIDGNWKNNKLENLRILCPNCHSQTDTFCKNKTIAKKITRCVDCDKVISNKSIRCLNCDGVYKSKQLNFNYDKKELEKLIFDDNLSLREIRKMFGVKCNKTMKRRLRKLGINLK